MSPVHGTNLIVIHLDEASSAEPVDERVWPLVDAMSTGFECRVMIFSRSLHRNVSALLERTPAKNRIAVKIGLLIDKRHIETPVLIKNKR